MKIKRAVFVEQLRTGIVICGYETFPNTYSKPTFKNIEPFTITLIEKCPAGYIINGTDDQGRKEQLGVIYPRNRLIIEIEKYTRLRFK